MSKTILLVEDEAVIRDAFLIILSANGYTVTTAVNGQEALDLCAQHTFDLIILDLMMPVLDGIGFLKRAKLRETAPSTRVIMLSNLSSNETTKEVTSLDVHRQEVKASLAPRELVALVKAELAERP